MHVLNREFRWMPLHERTTGNQTHQERPTGGPGRPMGGPREAKFKGGHRRPNSREAKLMGGQNQGGPKLEVKPKGISKDVQSKVK